jgi:peptidoglycan-N-acetylglucosamine deacetylase
MPNAETFQWPDACQAAVSLSFDDARPSQTDAGLPVLDRYGVRATFYLSPPNIAQRQDTWRAAAARGHEMGNHTLTHPCTGNFPWSINNALEEKTIEQIVSEINSADVAIHELAGVQPKTFAYPCGQKYIGRGETLQSYVPVVARHFIAGRGFRDEAVNNPAFFDPAQSMGVDSDDHSFDFLKTWIDRAVQESGWLVFCSHDIGQYSRQAMTVEVLDSVCQYCTSATNHIWVDTVATVAAYIRQQRG